MSSPAVPLSFSMVRRAPENAGSGDPNDVPSQPPKLRPKPQQRSIGPGKQYPDLASFKADLNAWEAEHASRKVAMQEREKHHSI